MANWENFPSDLKFAPTEFAGSAELALHLGGFVNSLAEFAMLAADRIEFVAKQARFLAGIAGGNSKRLSCRQLGCTNCGPRRNDWRVRSV